LSLPHKSFIFRFLKCYIMKLRGLFGLLMLGFLWSCTPKILENTADPAPAQEKVQKDERCLTFSDLSNSQEIIQYHVLYRDHIRENRFLEAYPFWKKAYEAAPMADGRRNFHFTDGIKIYQHKAELAESTEEKALLIDSLQQVFAHWKYCFQGQPKGIGQIAFEMYYGFREIFKDSLIFLTFKESIDANPDNIPYFVINPFTDLLIKAYIDTLATREETQYYAQLLLQRVEEGWLLGRTPRLGR
jgi:hypothetical protein